ncbi:MAG: hypothetical protein KatS3mg081_0832 [Gemmatimonadales bacterium]|nr:MAG: hypothetical protein KatS3mg081_0832 [Gemmatimonadales bacterium]
MRTSVATLGVASAIFWNFVSTPLRAQEPRGPEARNHIFVELGGPGLLYSANYERLLSGGWNVRIGCSSADLFIAYASCFAGGSKLVVGRRSGLELGAFLGLLELRRFLFLEADPRATGAYAGLIAGYRYLPRIRGLSFRISATPLATTEGVAPWGGISLGYAF